jgi:DNA-binding response OmpR family regulator
MIPRTLDILLVDDDAPLRDMLTRSFAREGHRITAVADGHEALAEARDGRFDVVLLDVALGQGPNGHEVCRSMRARRDVTPIIMLTALDAEADTVQGLEAGADDCVTKPFGLAELRSRIRSLLRRSQGHMLDGEQLRIGPIEVDREARAVSAHGAPVRLTFAEYELLVCLMERAGRMVNRQELLRAIDVHIRDLREKLESDPVRPVLIQTIRGAGYRFRDP